MKIKVWDIDNRREIRYPLLYCGDVYEGYDNFENGDGITNYVVSIGTNLKDKDGVEIYSGDVLESPTGYLSEVFYTGEPNIYCGVTTKEEDGSYFITFFHMMDFPNRQNPNCKIVGNIYENPNLLLNSKKL